MRHRISQICRTHRPGRMFQIPVVLLLSVAALTAPVTAGDWPQILGPHRNAQADDERLAQKWPDNGPPVLWKHDLGQGLAGPAIAKGRVLVFHRVDDEEVLEALDAASGKPLWKAAFPTRYVSTISSDNGPRCVPTVDDGRVFAFGAGGDLHCVALDDGKKLWSRTLNRDYGTIESYFGAGSSPLAIDGKLLVNVGGHRQDAGIVALDPKTGRTLWKSTDEQASYSSPVPAIFGGKLRVVFITRYHLLAVDPADGSVVFRVPFGKRGPTVNGANPVVLDGNRIFASASYGVGALLVKVEGENAKTIWSGDETMSSQYPTSVLHKGTMYGVDGRQDVGVARLRAFDPSTGKVLWTEEGFGMATLIAADDKLLAMKVDGELLLIQPSPEKYQPLAKTQIADDLFQALPALSAGRFYVRDRRTLWCLDVGGDRNDGK